MLRAVQLTMRTNECDQNPAKSEYRDTNDRKLRYFEGIDREMRKHIEREQSRLRVVWFSYVRVCAAHVLHIKDAGLGRYS